MSNFLYSIYNKKNHPIIRELLLIILFGTLTYFFNKIKIILPGVDGLSSDFREIPLLISLFYIKNPLSFIGIVFFGHIDFIYSDTVWHSFFSHTISLIISWYFFHYLKRKNISHLLTAIIWSLYIGVYYLGLVAPLYIFFKYITGFVFKIAVYTYYKQIIYFSRFEVLSSVMITSLYLVQLNVQRELKEHKYNLERKVKDRTKKINSQNEEINFKNKELLLQNNEILNQAENLKTTLNIVEEQNIKLHESHEELESSNEELKEYKNIVDHKNKELSETINKLKDAQTLLVKNEKMVSLGVLTAGVAHEINNPMNFISGGIQSMEENYQYLNEYLSESDIFWNNLPKEYKEKVKKLKEEKYLNDILKILPKLISNIKNGVNRINEIVKGLKTFSRLDEVEYKKADIHIGIDSTLLILKNKFQNRINIVKDYSSDIKDIICYPGQLNQVFMNIINNAIDSIKETGTITIKTQKADLKDKKEFNVSEKHIKISIKDTGVGINKKVIDKIFDPFFTTKEVGKGTGLGLSITHGIIKKHNGQVFIKSMVNEGSEFILFLPEIL